MHPTTDAKAKLNYYFLVHFVVGIAASFRFLHLFSLIRFNFANEGVIRAKEKQSCVSCECTTNKFVGCFFSLSFISSAIEQLHANIKNPIHNVDSRTKCSLNMESSVKVNNIGFFSTLGFWSAFIHLIMNSKFWERKFSLWRLLFFAPFLSSRVNDSI